MLSGNLWNNHSGADTLRRSHPNPIFQLRLLLPSSFSSAVMDVSGLIVYLYLYLLLNVKPQSMTKGMTSQTIDKGIHIAHCWICVDWHSLSSFFAFSLLSKCLHVLLKAVVANRCRKPGVKVVRQLSSRTVSVSPPHTDNHISQRFMNTNESLAFIWNDSKFLRRSSCLIIVSRGSRKTIERETWPLKDTEMAFIT